MSTFRVEVVPVSLAPHPDADQLSLVHVYNYVCVVRTEDWQGIDRGAYIPPDSIVPDTEAYAFLGSNKRVRTRKFRGVWSQGLLMPAPEGAALGDDVAEQLGIVHYEPPLRLTGVGPQAFSEGVASDPPPGNFPHYDVEHLRRYADAFVAGEPVYATEKIHGANARFTFHDGRFFAGSRKQWKQESLSNLWWRCLRQYPGLQEYLVAHPLATVYGEVYGAVQDLRYGHENGSVAFACFDIWKQPTHDYSSHHWLRADLLRMDCDLWGIPRVPDLFVGPFDFERLETLATGHSTIPGAEHMREGIVVRPAKERYVPDVGRLQLKLINNAYLEHAA